VLVTSTDYDWRQAEEAEVTYCSPSDCQPNQVKVLSKFVVCSCGAVLCNVVLTVHPNQIKVLRFGVSCGYYALVQCWEK